MSSKIGIYMRSLMASWVGYGANIIVMFFLSPFVVHALGKEAYGVWTLLASLTGYLGLADMGIRGGLGRFLNYYLAKQDIPRANSIFSAATVFFLICGAVLAIACAALCGSFGALFPKIPAELRGCAQAAVWLIALNLWLTFFSAGFAQVLTAFERFDLSNIIDVVSLAIRTAGTIVVLAMGGGLIELAEVQVLSTVAAVALGGVMAKRVFPPLQLSLSLARREQFRELFAFSFWAFVGGIASQLLYWTDAIVIVILLGPVSATYYAVGSMLIIYSRGLLQQCSAVLFPQVVKHCATRDWPALRQLVANGSTLMMTLGIVILVGLLVFGREFIILWMGEDYQRGYTVLAILAVSQFTPFAAAIGSHVFAGLNRNRLGAVLTLAQGLINLALSLGLVVWGKMGIEGVAWGTFYPRVIFAMICGVLVLRWIGLPVRQFLLTTASRWVAVTVVFLLVALVVRAIPAPNDWPHFLMKVTLALLAYIPLAWTLMPTKATRISWQTQLLARFRKASV